MIYTVRISPPHKQSGHYDYEWSIIPEQGPPCSGHEAIHTAINTITGATLIALQNTVAKIPDGEPIYIENPERLFSMDIVILRPSSKGPLYQAVNALLDKHPVRLKYDQGDTYQERLNVHYPWPKSSTPALNELNRPDSQQTIQQLKQHIVQLKATIQQMTHDREELDWLLQDARSAYVQLEQNAETWQSRYHQAIQQYATPTDHVGSLSSSADWGTDLMAKAEEKLFELWSRDLWLRLSYSLRLAIIQPIMMADLVKNIDFLGDESYEWAAFLLARTTESLLNDLVITQLFEWLEADNRLASDNPHHILSPTFVQGIRQIVHDKIIWQIPVIGHNPHKPSEFLSVQQPSHLSLDQVTKLFWNTPYTEHYAEWQETVRQFQQAYHLEWMQHQDIYKTLDILRKTIRNIGAHRMHYVKKEDYQKWEEIMIGTGPLHNDENASAGWWFQWIQHCYSF